MATVSEIIGQCQALYDDLDFGAAKAWKEAEAGRKVIGYMPIYVPREIIHAAGMLPLGILGGGDQLEVIHGDAFYQSYICRIPRSTVELAISGRLDFVDGMLFPSICDVIRNLSGMWDLMMPGKYVRYFDLPQNYDDDIGGDYYRHELAELRQGLEELGGRPITDDALRASIGLYNRNRDLLRQLYEKRSNAPWQVPTTEVYLLLRAGMVLPIEDHNRMLEDYLAAVGDEDRPMRDNCRVVMQGLFCEQPPLNLIKSIELAGCYVVDDDFMMVTRWLTGDVPTDGDPWANLASAFLHHSVEISARYVENESDKGQFLVDRVRKTGGEGVIFASPSFCDPALLDRPMAQDALKEANIPYIAFKYAENSGQMQPIREQAGTFSDSIKLWSAA